MSSEVLPAVKIWIAKITGFWDTAPCSLVETDRRFSEVRTASITTAMKSLMMGPIRTSETSVYYNETTRPHIPEGVRRPQPM
jgi:hypothetical protein